MSVMAHQITGVSIVRSTVCSGADQRKHQSSASLAFVRGIHRSPVDSPHKGPTTRKMFPMDDIFVSPLKLGHRWVMSNYMSVFHVHIVTFPCLEFDNPSFPGGRSASWCGKSCLSVVSRLLNTPPKIYPWLWLTRGSGRPNQTAAMGTCKS